MVVQPARKYQAETLRAWHHGYIAGTGHFSSGYFIPVCPAQSRRNRERQGRGALAAQ